MSSCLYSVRVVHSMFCSGVCCFCILSEGRTGMSYPLQLLAFLPHWAKCPRFPDEKASEPGKAWGTVTKSAGEGGTRRSLLQVSPPSLHGAPIFCYTHLSV